MSTRRLEPPCPAQGWRAFLCVCLTLLFAAIPQAAFAAAPTPVVAAIADFDNVDTSGESAERTAAHAARVQAFGGMLRESLSAEEAFRVVPLVCPASPCSPDVLSPAKFIAAARDSGARLVVYGSIRKMSTLVQIGVVQAIDLKTDSLLLDQRLTFRGDNDEAFRRAADFVADYLKELPLAP